MRATVSFAARHVPHYRELFAALGVDPLELRTAADLDRLPGLDRELVQALEGRLRSDGPAGRGAIPFRTTGSTAVPLTVYHDRASLIANIAYSERERVVESTFAGRRYRYDVLELRATAGTVGRMREFYGRQSFRPLRPRHRLLSVDTPPERVIDAINELRPDIVRSYGGYLELLFRTAAGSSGLRHRPKAVLYSGDAMNTAGRALIEDEFGVPVLSVYAAVEAFKIAFVCERRAGFHVHEDLCHVRLVGQDLAPVPAGEPGELVISNLTNRGTVLLNYRLGDVARLAEEPCECGRTSARLVDIDGRVDEFIDFGDGSYLYPTRLWDVFRARPEIRHYQLVQRRRDLFELRVVVDDAGLDSASRAAAELHEILRGATVKLTRHDELPVGPGGKFQHLVPLSAQEPR